MQAQQLKKILQFIAIAMIFITLTDSVNAQRKCHKGSCPPGYVCAPSGYCFRLMCRGCNMLVDEATADSRLDESKAVSIKIYDATGRLVRTLADENMQQRLRELAWDEKDDKGNTVSPGMYVLQLNTGSKMEIAKLTVAL
jgi:hypothetical protein